MTVESIWFISGAIFGGILYFYFAINLIVGLIIGAFIGFLITTTMKLLNYTFSKSGEWSSSNSSSCSDDDW